MPTCTPLQRGALAAAREEGERLDQATLEQEGDRTAALARHAGLRADFEKLKPAIDILQVGMRYRLL